MKRQRETPEIAAFGRRILLAWCRRAADGDPADLTELLAATTILDDGIRAAVTGQRATYGTSWAAIGAAAGITRQAAQQRWGRAADDGAPTRTGSSERSAFTGSPAPSDDGGLGSADTALEGTS